VIVILLFIHSHCHPVQANLSGCNVLNLNHISNKNDVSGLKFVLLFSTAATMPNWCDERWKTDFFATPRLDLFLVSDCFF